MSRLCANTCLSSRYVSIFAIIFRRLVQTSSYFQRFGGGQRYIFYRKDEPSRQTHCREKLIKFSPNVIALRAFLPQYMFHFSYVDYQLAFISMYTTMILLTVRVSAMTKPTDGMISGQYIRSLCAKQAFQL